MNEWIVFFVGFGLVLDIIGVCFLFVTTSARHTEAEMYSKVIRKITDEMVEWTKSYSFEEHMRRLANLEQRVRRNRHWAQVGLALVVLGFVLQLLGLIIAEWE